MLGISRGTLQNMRVNGTLLATQVGGFYDDLGNLTRQPHLVRDLGFAKDPYFLESSVVSMVGQFDGSVTLRRRLTDHPRPGWPIFISRNTKRENAFILSV